MGKILNWKPIPNFEGLYDISDTGLVRARKKKREGTEIYLKEKLIKGRDKGKGYKQVILHKNGVKTPMDISVAVALAFVGDKGEMILDHKDGNPKNNNLSNLRYCDRAQNKMNSRKHPNTSSIYKGVSWDKQTKKWRAYIRVKSVLKHLGFYQEESDAAKKYNNNALKYFGEFALINKIYE